MQYFITFLEGVITFVSPCLLPMLPVYVSYFAGGKPCSTKETVLHALGFVAGFTAVFVILGALAGTIGGALEKYQTAVNVISGAIVIFLGLRVMGFFQIYLFRGRRRAARTENLGFFSAMLFGIVFSLGWTPCVGAFLGSALMLASQQGHLMEGVLLLLSYSLGLGIPFLFSAVLIDRLKTAFGWIKEHYRMINGISGLLLIAIGVMMAAGMLERILSLLS